MTVHTTILTAPAPRVGDRHPSLPGVVWTGWAGWQRCATCVHVVPADRLTDAETALSEADTEVRDLAALAEAWRAEALRLRREVTALRLRREVTALRRASGHGAGVAAG